MAKIDKNKIYENGIYKQQNRPSVSDTFTDISKRLKEALKRLYG